MVRNPEELPAGSPEGSDYKINLNPASLEVLRDCKLEPMLERAIPGERYQFERLGYFYLDPTASKDGRRVFNRIVSLKDAWTKVEKKQI
jgi:glutaminyl-tRNA synthetase